MFGELLLTALMSISTTIWQFNDQPSVYTEEPAINNTTAKITEFATTTTIAPGSSRVAVAKIVITPSCTNVPTFTSITMQRSGLGAKEDIAGIYVSHNDIRTTTSKRITNKSHVIDLSLRSIQFEPCVPTAITVHVDFKDTMPASSIHRFKVLQINASEPVELIHTVPRKTNTVPSRQIGLIEIKNVDLAQTVRFGTKRTIGRIQLKNTGNTALRIQAITFTNNGSARNNDITNMYLQTRTGTVFSNTTTELYSRIALLTLNPNFTVNSGDTVELHLIGDVHVGRSETIGFTVEEPSDVVSVSVHVR